MQKIIEKYKEQCSIKSDINEHLPILYDYAKNCSHITEFGVRGVVSTWALLASKPNKFICYDISNLDLDEPKKLCKENKINFSFIMNNVLDVSIEITDLLFIDTIHTYHQLFTELSMHSEKVKKYIIMHDTMTYGENDEPCYIHNYNCPIVTGKKGLKLAIDDFLKSEFGKKWEIITILENNNGLTIIKRIYE